MNKSTHVSNTRYPDNQAAYFMSIDKQTHMDIYELIAWYSENEIYERTA